MSTPDAHPALAPFTPRVREWFTRAFAEPTPAQVQAWPAISAGAHTLVSAPTGSGKTLAAFLWALDRFVADPPPANPKERTLRLVYVSPLKALGYDVERNLRAPLRGIGADVTGGGPHRRHAAEGARGHAAHVRPTSSSPPPSRCTSCSPRRRSGCSPARSGSSSTRSTQWRRPSAARTWPSRWSGWPSRRAATCSASGSPPRSGRSRRSPATSSARRGSAPSSTRACASRSTCASTCRSSPWSSRT